ncbi:MAG TPA: hypothetical protein VFR42_05075, partial [Candidatus Acidoferrum sp.]|nr:hypothetical protein [Candidatus Acidoferrum sp.]
LLACGLLAGASGTKIAFAQEKKDAGTGAAALSGKSAADMPAAKPADVKTLDAIVAAVYDVISGPPGERDWNRFNSLFTKDARLIAVRTPKDGGKPSLAVMTPADYAAHAGGYFKEHGFFEHELSRKTDSFGAMTHVYTTYESRETKDGKPIDRGINSMEFFFDGERWWCVQIYWDAERPGNPIPEKYLGK